MHHRTADLDDVEPITALMAEVFAGDPLWGPALESPDGSTDHLRDYWRIFVRSAMRYPVSGVAGEGRDVDAAAVWIPPGGEELLPEEFDAVVALLRERLPGSVDALLELFDRFEGAHPGDVPHYYLSLLATAPRSRGRGVGMALLRDDLARIDAEGMPAYLESSNPANDARYGSVGFRPVSSFAHPTTGHEVTGMWRPARG